MLMYLITMLLILFHASVITILKIMNIIYCTVLLYLMRRHKMLQTLQTNINVQDLHVDTLLQASSDFD